MCNYNIFLGEFETLLDLDTYIVIEFEVGIHFKQNTEKIKHLEYSQIQCGRFSPLHTVSILICMGLVP